MSETVIAKSWIMQYVLIHIVHVIQMSDAS